MFVLKVESERNGVFTLTQNESNYQVIGVSGLNPPNAIINSSTVAGMDGEIFQSSKLETRNIVLTIKINGNVEANRIYLYRYFKTKKWCKIYYKNNSRDVYIEGYVESIECDLFELGQQMQISIICHSPYFKSLQEIMTDISEEIAAFEFPFAFGADGAVYNEDMVPVVSDTDDAIEFSTIYKNKITNVINAGEVESGVIIELTATAQVTNPVIYNANDGQQAMKLNIVMQQGDKIVINTSRGQKSVILNPEGERENIITKLVPLNFSGTLVYPTWFQLQIGDNEFTYSADSGSEFLYVVFKHHTLYEGV